MDCGKRGTVWNSVTQGSAMVCGRPGSTDSEVFCVAALTKIYRVVNIVTFALHRFRRRHTSRCARAFVIAKVNECSIAEG